MRLRIAEIVEACGGKLLCGNPNMVVRSFFTDSRKVDPSGMFVPIKGARVDAHRMIDQIFRQGAVASFTQHELPPRGDTGALIYVKNNRLALQQAAAYYRKRFTIPVIGVTGSVGKTTVKEMMAATLSAQRTVLKTAGNQNSQVGVPITVCNLKRAHEAAVVEMGISLAGEMTALADVVRPTYAVITNIGQAHLEFLKTQENILAEKLKIAKDLPAEGILFVNGDDPLLAPLRQQDLGYQVRTFGLSPDCDFYAAGVRQVGTGTFFTFCQQEGDPWATNNAEVFLPITGDHNVRNAMAALAVAKTLGLEAEAAFRALGTFKMPEMRQEVHKLSHGIVLIDDSYNASPESMTAAVDILTGGQWGFSNEFPQRRRRSIAVLGDMLELGHRGPAAHYQLGLYAAKSGVDCLVGVGELSMDMCRGFAETKGLSCEINPRKMENTLYPDVLYWTDNAPSALLLLNRISQDGDIVLVKGSRGVGMDIIPKRMRNIPIRNRMKLKSKK